MGYGEKQIVRDFMYQYLDDLKEENKALAKGGVR